MPGAVSRPPAAIVVAMAGNRVIVIGRGGGPTGRLPADSARFHAAPPVPR